MTGVLPPTFSDLEAFVKPWGVATMRERLNLRISSSGEERVQFYQAMVPRLTEIMVHLDQYTLKEMPDDASRLLQLMLSLAEISLTEEVNGQTQEAIHATGNALLRFDKELDGR